ncbi:hypothetical protein ACFPYJ_29205 [Paenibacillus solisilvae]|uniref:Uncharacterized protein n=1 Tax=Paenibacillus solisilvae TaxID=2486751 RepID=A0ABW0W741_9BACL
MESGTAKSWAAFRGGLSSSLFGTTYEAISGFIFAAREEDHCPAARMLIRPKPIITEPVNIAAAGCITMKLKLILTAVINGEHQTSHTILL